MGQNNNADLVKATVPVEMLEVQDMSNAKCYGGRGGRGWGDSGGVE